MSGRNMEFASTELPGVFPTDLNRPLIEEPARRLAQKAHAHGPIWRCNELVGAAIYLISDRPVIQRRNDRRRRGFLARGV